VRPRRKIAGWWHQKGFLTISAVTTGIRTYSKRRHRPITRSGHWTGWNAKTVRWPPHVAHFRLMHSSTKITFGACRWFRLAVSMYRQLLSTIVGVTTPQAQWPMRE
jgi:hypothetical protein